MKEVGLIPTIWNNVVVAAEAIERGIELSTRGRGTALIMQHSKVVHYWRMGVSSLNSPLAVKSVDHEEITSRLLRGAGIDAPENVVFGADDADRAWAWAEPAIPVMLKSNNDCGQTGVVTNLDNRDEFLKQFRISAAFSDEVLVSQFRTGDVYRVLVIDNKVVAATRRVPANVTGNGRSTIVDLVNEKNECRPRSHKKIVLDEVVDSYLSHQGLSVQSIPLDGQTIVLRGVVNLHTGDDFVDATDELTSEQISQCEAATRAIPGLGACGIDLLVPALPSVERPRILKISSNPMISMQHFPTYGAPRNVARAVVNAMFPDTALPVDSPMNQSIS